MIKKLYIKNYALIKEVNIDFSSGFNVISGETGSGKSILLDALSQLLGKKNHRFIANKEKCIIEGTFKVSEKFIYFFKKLNIDFHEDTIIRREINSSGRNRNFINDTPVLLNTLAQFANKQIEIFTQNNSDFIKNEKNRFKIIDNFSNSSRSLIEYQKEFFNYQNIKKELEIIKSNGRLTEIELDFLKYQHNELENANLENEDKESIENKISFLENIDNINLLLNECKAIIENEETGLITQLNKLYSKLVKVNNFNELAKRVNSLSIELDDINHELRAIYSHEEHDTNKLSILYKRIDIINNLLQKHNLNSINELLELKRKLYSKIELSKSFEELVIKKKKEKEISKEKLIKLADNLFNERIHISKKLKQKIEKLLQKLAIQYSKFSIIQKTKEEFNKYGNTNIDFYFSANKGKKEQDLTKIASGGELSRLMLVIKYITSKKSQIDTLIFDEIDSGVSGEVASLMGNMMKKISKEKQLIVISHIPQIASQGDHHLKVNKIISHNNTFSQINKLNDKERINEIAKLLSGKNITSAAIKNAVELLNQ